MGRSTGQETLLVGKVLEKLINKRPQNHNTIVPAPLGIEPNMNLIGTSPEYYLGEVDWVRARVGALDARQAKNGY